MDCPACHKTFTRTTKKSTCPHCEVELHVPSSKSKARKEGIVLLKSEYDCAVQIVDRLIMFIQERDQCVFPMSFSERSKEMLFCYRFIIRCRVFMANQRLKLGHTLDFTTESFAVAVIEAFLADPWIKERVKTFLMFENQITRQATKVWASRQQDRARQNGQRMAQTSYIAPGFGVTNVSINLPASSD